MVPKYSSHLMVGVYCGCSWCEDSFATSKVHLLKCWLGFYLASSGDSGCKIAKIKAWNNDSSFQRTPAIDVCEVFYGNQPFFSPKILWPWKSFHTFFLISVRLYYRRDRKMALSGNICVQVSSERQHGNTLMANAAPPFVEKWKVYLFQLIDCSAFKYQPD